MALRHANATPKPAAVDKRLGRRPGQTPEAAVRKLLLAEPPTFLALALRNFGVWTHAEHDVDAAADELATLNAKRRTIVLFRIEDGEAAIVAKPDFFTDAEMESGFLPIPLRARLYRDALKEASQGVAGRSLLAIELEDGHFPTKRAPIFSFQKPQGSNNILLPDVDFLIHKYYESDAFLDGTLFFEKSDRAIFVGSTTGVPINRAVLDAGMSWRIRSGLYFKNHPLVDFRLPNIVMCESPEIEEEVRGFGIGGESASWREQFTYKYMLSMDGNGATCSRVALGLKSDCVLVKYESVHQLYYFPYMQPWVHYVPVAADRDVERVLAYARVMPEMFVTIARESRRFYEEFLTKADVLSYMRLILTIYRENGPRFQTEHFARFPTT